MILDFLLKNISSFYKLLNFEKNYLIMLKSTKILENSNSNEIIIISINNLVFRINNLRWERTKIFREFKRLENAKALMKGYEIFYNFIRVHQAIGKCPYELATDLKLKNKNKWLELIRLSSFLNKKYPCNSK